MSTKHKIGAVTLLLAAFLSGLFVGITASPHGESVAYVTRDERGRLVRMNDGVQVRVPF